MEEQMLMMTPKKFFFIMGAILGFFAVAAGAFGAHVLKNKIENDLLDVFEIGVRYQMYHALALMILGVVAIFFDHPYLKSSAWFFLSGTLIFSGSLYALALTGIRTFGMITPIGGVFLLIGWFCLIVGSWRS